MTSLKWRLLPGRLGEKLGDLGGLEDLARELHFPVDSQSRGEKHTGLSNCPRIRHLLNLCLDTRCVFYNQSAWWRAANHGCLKRGGDTCHVAPQGKRCHAAFSGDLAPALMALDAQAEIASATGMRRMPLAALYRDDGAAHLTLAPGELVSRVHVPRDEVARSGYRKARVRGAIDFPLAGVAIALAIEGEHIARLRVALTGVNSQPLAQPETDSLAGRRVDAALLAELGKRVAKAVSPMRTTATASNYRRQVASVLAQRLLRDLAGS